MRCPRIIMGSLRPRIMWRQSISPIITMQRVRALPLRFEIPARSPPPPPSLQLAVFNCLTMANCCRVIERLDWDTKESTRRVLQPLRSPAWPCLPWPVYTRIPRRITWPGTALAVRIIVTGIMWTLINWIRCDSTVERVAAEELIPVELDPLQGSRRPRRVISLVLCETIRSIRNIHRCL